MRDFASNKLVLEMIFERTILLVVGGVRKKILVPGGELIDEVQQVCLLTADLRVLLLFLDELVLERAGP